MRLTEDLINVFRSVCGSMHVFINLYSRFSLIFANANKSSDALTVSVNDAIKPFSM